MADWDNQPQTLWLEPLSARERGVSLEAGPAESPAEGEVDAFLEVFFSADLHLLVNALYLFYAIPIHLRG